MLNFHQYTEHVRAQIVAAGVPAADVSVGATDIESLLPGSTVGYIVRLSALTPRDSEDGLSSTNQNMLYWNVDVAVEIILTRAPGIADPYADLQAKMQTVTQNLRNRNGAPDNCEDAFLMGVEDITPADVKVDRRVQLMTAVFRFWATERWE